MITVFTAQDCIMFNLSSFDAEQEFKEFALNKCIDRENVTLRIRMREEDSNKVVDTIEIKTDSIKRIVFEKRHFYYNLHKEINSL